MKQIYLVVAQMDYETTHNIKAFAIESKAKKFVKKCIDYEARAPEPPELSDSDIKWDEYEVEYEKFRDKHPAGVSNVNAESYFYEIIDFQE